MGSAVVDPTRPTLQPPSQTEKERTMSTTAACGGLASAGIFLAGALTLAVVLLVSFLLLTGWQTRRNGGQIRVDYRDMDRDI